MESRLPGEIATTSDMQMIPFKWYQESEKKLKNLLMKVKEKSAKADFKLNIKKPRSCHPVSSLHGK